jgi:hypothetical protein
VYKPGAGDPHRLGEPDAPTTLRPCWLSGAARGTSAVGREQASTRRTHLDPALAELRMVPAEARAVWARTSTGPVLAHSLVR